MRGGGRGPLARALRLGLAGLFIAAMTACGTVGPGPDGRVPDGESMSWDQFGQNDLNRAETLAMRDNLDSLQRLMEKLYRRNPAEWRKAGYADVEAAIRETGARLRAGQAPPDLQGLRDIEVLSVALEPAYQGDRVAAFVLGLSSMIIAAHGGRTRFHVGDHVDAQRVFNAARNVETSAWLLATRRDEQGRLLLLSNAMADGATNLSFEREFGRIIARLDLIAELLDESVRRIGINYLQGLLLFNFLPVR